MCSLTNILSYAQILIRVIISDGSEAPGWTQWNTLYNLTEQHPKLNVGKLRRMLKYTSIHMAEFTTV
jgi:hypothetical protein